MHRQITHQIEINGLNLWNGQALSSTQHTQLPIGATLIINTLHLVSTRHGYIYPQLVPLKQNFEHDGKFWDYLENK